MALEGDGIKDYNNSQFFCRINVTYLSYFIDKFYIQY